MACAGNAGLEALAVLLETARALAGAAFVVLGHICHFCAGDVVSGFAAEGEWVALEDVVDGFCTMGLCERDLELGDIEAAGAVAAVTVVPEAKHSQ